MDRRASPPGRASRRRPQRTLRALPQQRPRRKAPRSRLHHSLHGRCRSRQTRRECHRSAATNRGQTRSRRRHFARSPRPKTAQRLQACAKCSGEKPLIFLRKPLITNKTSPTTAELGLSPGDIVISDNLSSHKSPDVRDALQEVGADIACLPPYSPDMNPTKMVFCKIKAYLRANPSLQEFGADIACLPPYGPDMNPIEMVFSKIKAYLRANPSEQFEQIVQRMAESLNSFSKTICANLFTHAKYLSK